MKPLAQQLISTVLTANPLQSNYIAGCHESLEAEEKDRFEAYLLFLTGHGIELRYLAECYNTVVEDIKREQVHFRRHRRYRYEKLADLSNSVYMNDEYMQKYMYGLAITSFFWPNHILMNRFFVQHLPRDMTGKYCEVGPGPGLHFTTALSLCHFDAYHAVDISPKSAALTRNLIDSGLFGSHPHCEIRIADFLTAEFAGRPYQALVMGEVIEHVELPEAFLGKAHAITTPDAFIYITTAINAPAVDHIYLLRSWDDFDQLVTKMGFRCRHQLLLPYSGKTIHECEQESLPMNVAAVLDKK